MQRISLSQAKAGMVLAQAVHRPDGLVLIGEGLVLTDTAIERIRSVGIGIVCVEGNPLGAEGTVGDLGKVAARLPFLFRRQRDNVLMMTLCGVLSRHFVHRVAEQKALEEAAIERAREAAAQAAAEAEQAARERAEGDDA